jgi:outer membrane receptor protein involved in Fe transport
MPTETKRPSDLLEHYDVKALTVLSGTEAIPKSGILLDIKGLIIAFFLALITSHAALGVDGDSGANNILNPIIVTATRTAENESQIGSAASQLTAEQLETEQIYNVKQALNTTPGVFSLETGASGGFTTVSIRGNDPSYSLVLVDGIRVNTGIFDNADPFLAYAQTFRRDQQRCLRQNRLFIWLRA